MKAPASILRRSSGVTLVETVLVTAILGVVTLPLARFIASALKTTIRVDTVSRSQMDVQQALMWLERDLGEMVEVRRASPEELEFLLESTRMPNFQVAGQPYDFMNPDQDGDMGVVSAPGGVRLTGDDLADDDDDGDGNVDVRCRYVLEDRTLWREMSFNGGPWTGRRKMLGGLTSFQFSYRGSADESRRRAARGLPPLDVLPAGAPDGVVTGAEIDQVPGLGNNNGAPYYDTPSERAAIATVGYSIAQDKNGDGRPDFSVESEVTPPLLPLKGRT